MASDSLTDTLANIFGVPEYIDLGMCPSEGTVRATHYRLHRATLTLEFFHLDKYWDESMHSDRLKECVRQGILPAARQALWAYQQLEANGLLSLYPR